MVDTYALEILIIRTRPTLWCHPGDDFVGVLDIAGLAVHAVGGVDLQAFSGGVFYYLVDAGGAEAGAGVVVFLGAAGDADRCVGDLQVHRLVFVVLGGGVVDALQAVARGEGALHVVTLGLFMRAHLVE